MSDGDTPVRGVAKGRKVYVEVVVLRDVTGSRRTPSLCVAQRRLAAADNPAETGPRAGERRQAGHGCEGARPATTAC